MRIKLAIFFSCCAALCCAALVVTDFSGAVSDYYNASMKCVGNNKIVCWADEDNNNLWHCRAELWNGTTFVMTDLSGAVDSINSIDFTINAAGQAAVAWSEGFSPNELHKCSIWDGITWNSSTIGQNAVYSENLKIAENETGNVVVAWAETDSNYNYFVQGSYWDGLIWSNQAFTSAVASYVYSLDLCMDTAGTSATVWEYMENANFLFHIMGAAWNGGTLVP